MRDPRLDQLAKVLVHYSTQIKPGQLVRLSGDVVALPLIEALYEEVLRAGANPYVKLATQNMEDAYFELASDAQLQFLSPVLLEEVNLIDVSIGLWADTNTKALSQVDPSKQSKHSAARKPYMEVFFKRAAAVDKPQDYPGVRPLRWAGTQYPTEASAQDAEMSLRQYADFVFKAGYLDQPDPVAVWESIRTRQQKVADYLTGKKVLRFRTDAGTDLTVNVEGMTWVNCAGESNFPDGEVFTGPNLNAACGGVNGVVHYSFPAVHHGREVHDITLRFERGKVVEAHASKNLDFLNQMLDQDAGARTLGEQQQPVRPALGHGLRPPHRRHHRSRWCRHQQKRQVRLRRLAGE